MEEALGASFTGARAIVTMKHVGLNVAADPLFSASYIGATGALVIVSADDPGMHSSQNEQDNRHYAIAAKMPVLEPADSQEAKDMVLEAVKISETFDTPVMIRMTTRTSHSRSVVELGERQAPPVPEYKSDFAKRNLLPGNARKRHAAGRGAPEEAGRFQRQLRLQHHHQGQGTGRRPGLGRLLPVRPRGLPRRLVPEAGAALPLPGQAVPALRRHGRQDLRPGGERPDHRDLRPAGRAAEGDHRQGRFPAAGRTVPGRRARQPGAQGPDAALRRRRASPGARLRFAPAARTPPFFTTWAC